MSHNHHNHSCECCHEHHHEHNHHEHHHHHEEGKGKIVLLLVTSVLLAAACFIEKRWQLTTWQLLIVYLIPYLLVGHDTLKEALEGIAKGDMFNEHFLMFIATIGAMCIGFLPGAENEFPEAVFVMLFYQVGELFEGYAEGKSRDSIAHLMNIRPDTATLEKPDGNGGVKEESVAPEQVAVGSVIVVRPGEKIPLDGRVVSGTTSLNTVALTGESMPRDVAEGDTVVSGCVNLSGVIRVCTTKSFGESTVSKIIRLVESADEKKSQSETFITRFSRIYTPIVVAISVVLAVLPPTIGALFCGMSFMEMFATWLYRALVFLVVSCPCALVISVPLTFFGGIGAASRRGILIKGSSYIDMLAKVNTVVFDKTGTLTHGEFAVEAVHPDRFDQQELLHLAAHVEHFSTHPIGAALRDAFPNEATDGCSVADVQEIAGRGIRATVGNRIVCVGNSKMMQQIGAEWHDCHHTGTIIHVAVKDNFDGEATDDPFTYIGHIVINDRIKADSASAIAALKSLGVENTMMLTGDSRDVASDVAQKIGIDQWQAELLPADKVSAVEGILKNHATAFVGDGINDAPVLKRADVGIAMGGLGSDAAIEAADVVLMDDQPSKIATAIQLSRRTIGIARQNVLFAIGVKISVLLLASVGLASMGMAVFADVGVTVLAVFNAMRMLAPSGK